MSEVFRTPDESPEPVPTETPSDPNSYSSTTDTPLDREFKNNLEAWETEGKKKYVNEYFDTHNIYKDFSVKMSVSAIDKFVRAEMTDREYENTTDNYRKVIEGIEEEIGSKNLELFKRFNKLNGYIKVLTKLRAAKKSLGAYKPNV